MSTTDTASQATGSISGAADAIAALLDPSGELRTPDPQAAQSPDEGTLQVDTEEEETAEAAPEGDAEATSEEEAAEGEDTTEEVPELPKVVTVTVDGTSTEVPLEEAIRGYQRQQDYSRKTADLAEQRRAFEATQQSVTQERATYAQLIPALRQQLQDTLPKEPDPALLDSDPVTYLREERAYRDHLHRLQAAQFEANRTEAQREKEQQEATERALDEGRAKLLELIPEWKDSAKKKAGADLILNYAKTHLGASADDVSKVWDPRIMVALHDAAKFRALMANRPKPVASKGPKVAAAGSAQSTPRANTEITRAKQRLAQTGRPADAVAVLRGLL